MFQDYLCIVMDMQSFFKNKNHKYQINTLPGIFNFISFKMSQIKHKDIYNQQVNIKNELQRLINTISIGISL